MCPSLRVSFPARDMGRKWTGWYIASPMAQSINRPDGSEQIWLGSAGVGENLGRPQIYNLSSQRHVG